MSTRLCIFCLRVEGDPTPWVAANPGEGCQYGLHHEYEPGAEAKPKQPPRKVDKNICTKCNLHAKNPASTASDCAHEYPS